jgi:K+-sensing histidine kinase KdpD
LTYTFFLFPLFLIYAIVRYKAFDIEVLIRKGLVYAVLSSILLASYFALSYFGSMVFSRFFQIEEIAIASFSAVISTILVGKLNNRVQNIIDQTFYRQKVDLQRLLDKFIHEVANSQDKKAVSNTCFSYLDEVISPKSMALYLTGENQALRLLGAKNDNFPETLTGDTYSLLNNLSYFFNKSIDQENELVLPLLKDNNIVGLLFLGRKNSEMEYLFEERKFLQNIALTLSMVLQAILMNEKAIALALQNVELENNSKFINQLTTNLSHDLKSPVGNCRLTLNKMLFKLERKGTLDKEFLTDNINKLFRSFDKINEYISLSLDRDMISAGRLTLKQELVDVKQVVLDSIFLHTEGADKRSVRFNLNAPETEVKVIGDRVRFEHTISNIISNAVKFTKNNIDIDLKKEEGKVTIKIQDNGKGIRLDLREKIFKCFVNDGETVDSSYQSTGFGLFICKTYIELMGGNIWFKTENDLGTAFFIEMNLADQTVAESFEYYLPEINPVIPPKLVK